MKEGTKSTINEKTATPSDSARLQTLLDLASEKLKAGVQADLEETIKWCEEVYSIAKKTANKQALAQSAYLIGTSFTRIDIADESRVLNVVSKLQEALALYTELDDEAGKAKSRTSLNTFNKSYYRDDFIPIPGGWPEYSHTLGVFQHSLALYERTGNIRLQSSTHYSVGTIHRLRRNFSFALRSFKKSLLLATEVGDSYIKAACWLEIGKIAFEAGRIDEAIDCFETIVALPENRNAQEVMMRCYEGLWKAYKKVDNLEKAFECLEKLHEAKEDFFKQAMDDKVRTFSIRLATEKAEKEAEIERLKNVELAKALSDLRAAQTRLVQSEKLAALGELVAGIAHELQNPLNFVNNFSTLSAEACQELREELSKPSPDTAFIEESLELLRNNLEKINRHGARASSIIKGMLEHARHRTGERQPVKLNTLVDEYIKLAYHAARAKDHQFNATLTLHYDERIEPLQLVPQDISRVLLNLAGNAFYALNERRKLELTVNATDLTAYAPELTVTTRRLETGVEMTGVEISFHDNGTGITEDVKAKLFQPFFTTKPTGEGTGLGLSISHDIISKGHGGTLTVRSAVNHFTEFVITLPHILK